jgi:hypothetical protein
VTTQPKDGMREKEISDNSSTKVVKHCKWKYEE